MFSIPTRKKAAKDKSVKVPENLSRSDQKKIQQVIEKARRDDGVPRTAQQSIPFERMFPDGICRTGDRYYSKTIQYQDINYQLAQQEDKTAIFEEWCGFLNFFDSSIHFELSFMNMSTDVEQFEKSVRIPPMRDGFDDVRSEFSQMLRKQLAQGNNGLTKTKYLTFSIQADSMKQAKPRLDHVQTDLLNNFHRLGVSARVLNGKERLRVMHSMFHMGSRDKFYFDWSWLAKSGLSIKDFIAPTSFSFPGGRTFQMGNMYGAMSYLAITASDLSDQLLKDLLEMDSSEIVTLHIQSVDQNKAIKTVKHTITELDRSKIEEQKKAVRSGYDMDIIPSDLATYGKDAKDLLKELQSQNERMFLITFLVMNTGKTPQELENNVFQASSIAQKHNCNLRRLDFQQEQGLMSSLPLAMNQIEIQRALTTSSTAIFVPFTTQELYQDGKENFDNFTCDGSTESLSVSLQNLINALYSRDISRKVATALMAQQQNGTFRNRNLPYGYVWNEDKTAYAIDEEAAVHLRDIFRWKLEGASINQILQRLEDSGVSNPELRKRETGLREGDCVGQGWGRSTINSILQNPVYLGHTVHGKARSEVYKGRKRRRCPAEEWIVYENTHPALVSQEDFNAVQAMLAEASAEAQQKRAESASIRASMIDLFDKRCFCGDCGKRMYFRRHRLDKVVPERWAGTYNCSTFTSRRHETCTNHHIRQGVLEEKVFHAIQDQLKIALDYDKLLGVLKGSTGEANLKEKYNAAVSSVSIKLNALNQKRSRLYDNYVDGTLTESEYLYAKQTYEAEYERLTALQDEAIQRRNRFLESISPDNRWMHMMKAATHAEALTQELVDAMIERVLVYENGIVQIELRYDDVYQDMCRSVLEMQGDAASTDVAQADTVSQDKEAGA